MATKTEAKVTKTTAKATARKARETKATKVRVTAQKAEAPTLYSNVQKEAKTMQNKIKTAAAQAAEKATAYGKDLYAFNKANLDAVVESGKVAAKGTQTAAQHGVELTRKNWEANSAHAKALAGVRAPADFFKLQADFARKQFDATVAEFSKSTEFNLKLAREVVAPLQSRYADVAAQMKTRFAA